MRCHEVFCCFGFQKIEQYSRLLDALQYRGCVWFIKAFYGDWYQRYPFGCVSRALLRRRLMLLLSESALLMDRVPYTLLFGAVRLVFPST